MRFCFDLSTPQWNHLEGRMGEVWLLTFTWGSSLSGLSHSSAHWRGKCFLFTKGRPSLHLWCNAEFSECMKHSSWTAAWFLWRLLIPHLLWLRKKPGSSLSHCGALDVCVAVFCERMQACLALKTDVKSVLNLTTHPRVCSTPKNHHLF